MIWLLIYFLGYIAAAGAMLNIEAAMDDEYEPFGSSDIWFVALMSLFSWLWFGFMTFMSVRALYYQNKKSNDD